MKVKIDPPSEGHAALGITGYAIFHCPGCGHLHMVTIRGTDYKDQPNHIPAWTFNGDVNSPTFEPSVRQYHRRPKDNVEVTTCHFFVKGGRIQYLTDCVHQLAGQTVDLPDFPEETQNV